MTYKQDLYINKEKDICDLFLECLVSFIDDIEHPALIDEWKQDIDAAAYEKNLYKDVKLPSIQKKLIVMMKKNTGPKS